MKNFLKKAVPILIIIVLFLITYDDSYKEHHENRQELQNQREQLDQTLSNADYLTYDHPRASIVQTPDLDLLDTFVDMIDSADERVWVQVYIFTERRIRQSLIDAHARGVDVRVVLEPYVFGAPSINRETKSRLEDGGVEVIYASEDNYTFTHSKILLIDDIYAIGTGNISYSTFRHNQDFFAFGEDSAILTALESMWLADANHEKHIVVHPSLIVSPGSSREKLEGLIDSAEVSIDMHAQSLSDEGIKSLLKKKYDEGVSISLRMGNLKKYPANEDDIDELRSYGIEISTPQDPYVHAKAIFVDDKIGYIGSINFTQNSIENNREVGILIPIRD